MIGGPNADFPAARDAKTTIDITIVITIVIAKK